jgi:hypothetical protein
MGTPEKIYELVKDMPTDQATEVLDFVEFLRQKARLQLEATSQKKPLSDYLGLLKNSPTFQGDPVEIQRQLRNEWD